MFSGATKETVKARGKEFKAFKKSRIFGRSLKGGFCRKAMGKVLLVAAKRARGQAKLRTDSAVGGTGK